MSNMEDLISALGFQEEENEDDIGEKDKAVEEKRTEIEEEITYRSNALGDAYPFILSGDGKTLTLVDLDDNHAANSYILCLILSHVTGSEILQMPPKDEMVRQARKRLFQIVATLAAGGHANGGAVSLGWPREKKESIIQVVTRAVAGSGTGDARPAPHQLEPKGAKDGGLDVLAWRSAPDGPPPELFYFVQAASGHNWVGKSAKDDHLQFLVCYFSAQPMCNLAFITVCPFRLTENEKQFQQISHGTISDRTRAPAMVRDTLIAAENGNGNYDEVQNFPVISKWINRYRRENRALS